MTEPVMMTEAAVEAAAVDAGYGIERTDDGGLMLTRTVGGVTNALRVCTAVDPVGLTFAAAVAHLGGQNPPTQ